MTQALDLHGKVCYTNVNELSVNEREVIMAIRSIDSGHIVACKDKGCITHIKIEQTKKL